MAHETVNHKNKNHTDLILKNGMRVVLKKTTFDLGEVYVNLTAAGGYASLPLKANPSARLAPQIALETGFQEISADHFFSEELELNIEVMPYGRCIEGFAETRDLDTLLDYIARYFKINVFKPEAFRKTQLAALKVLSGAKFDHLTTFQEAFADINTQHFAMLKPLDAKDIQNAEIHLAEEMFKELFGKPDEFEVVIVGDFNEKSIVKKLEESLGTISPRETHINFNNAPLPNFPTQCIEKEIEGSGQKYSLARLSYPMKPMNTETYAIKPFFIELLAFHIGHKLRSKLNLSKEELWIEVFFDNPIYPCPDYPLLVIQYGCDATLVTKIKEAVLEEVHALLKDGFAQSEVDHLKKDLSTKDSFWLHDNEYWLHVLTDYHVLHWTMKENTGTPEEISQVTLGQVNKTLREIFSKDRYTFLYTTP